mgnify:FL=1
MKKRVNVYCNTPFVIGPAAFAGACENIVLEVNNIGTCIMNKAKVVEILADGTLVPLDFTNFDKDNGKSDVTENDVPITDKRKHSRPVIEVVDAVKEVKPAEVVPPTTTKEEAVTEKEPEVVVENSAEPVAETAPAQETNTEKNNNKYNKFKKSRN